MDFVDEFYADKDLSLLKKLTVVIPTYNRNFYLSRCLWYHSHFPFGEIIVADSSPENKKVVNRETVRQLVEKYGANIRYLEYPPETEKYGGDIIRKWGNAVQQVETEYSQICTDKEFLIPTTLCKCIAFLNENDDYDMAAGPRYDIKRSTRHDVNFFEAHPGRLLSIDYPDPTARLLMFSISPADTFNQMSLKRSIVYLRLYKLLNEFEIDDLRFGELGFELLSVISSKMIFYNNPQVCRDVIQLSSSWAKKQRSSESSARRYPLLNEYDKNGRYSEYMDRLSSCLTWEYQSLGSNKMTEQETKKMMSLAIKNLQKIRGFFGSPHSNLFQFGDRLLNSTPWKISIIIRKLLNKPEQLPQVTLSNETLIIKKIISDTRHPQKKDAPIKIG